MLKGYTRIELTNTKTQEKRIIENSNRITDTPSLVLGSPFGQFSTPTKSISYIPGYKTIFGGLLAYDKPIPNNSNFPSIDSTLIACGYYNYQNTLIDNRYGSYNQVESSINTTTKTCTHVYDFQTGHATGLISSICLAPIEAPSIFSGNLLSTPCFKLDFNNAAVFPHAEGRSFTFVRGNEASLAFAYYDWYDDTAVYASMPNNTTIRLKKVAANIRLQHLHKDDSIYTTEDIILNNVTWTGNTSMAPFYDYSEDKLWLINCAGGGQVANNGNIVLVSINLTNHQDVNIYTITNTTGNTLQGIGYKGPMFINKGSLYVNQYWYSNPFDRDYRNYYNNLYRCNISTGAFTLISNHVQECRIFKAVLENTILLDHGYYSSGYYSANSAYDITTGTQKYVSSFSQGGAGSNSGATYDTVESFVRGPLHWGIKYTSSGGQPYWIPDSISTANNLASPIYKAPDDFMKIIYTIQEV